jgi:NAD(P)-dependent dehydrogenase (short-subunit alcohol dehydrogenase family)
MTPAIRAALLQAEAEKRPLVLATRLPDGAQRILPSPDAEAALNQVAARAPGPIADLDPEAVRQSLAVTAFGGFLAVQQAARRALRQAAQGELGPHGIHVAHFIIDGGVRSAARPDPEARPDSTLSPDGVAQTYLDVLRQPRDAWSMEVELRPWVEKF